ncbi:MAG: cbb3-type cytochrome c oxidase N-terminal domain-containing protein [Lacibacter sp.]
MKKYFSPTVLLKVFLPFVLLFTALAATAQDKAATAADSAPKTVWNNPVAITMLVIILILLIVIAVLASVVTGTAKWQNMQLKNSGVIKTIAGIAVLLSPALASAQDAAAPVAETSSVAGLTTTTFYLLVSVIAVELLVVLLLGLFVMKFLSKQNVYVAQTAGAAGAAAPAKLTWWERFNGFRPAEQESNIDLGHDYDGIRELDNKLPGWWLWGFYLTIIVGIIYFYRYEVSHKGLSSKEQYEVAVKDAEAKQKAFLEKAGNNVDENTVTVLTDAAAISAGKANFIKTCATCHGNEAQGNIGPNLTDDYWIHGGSIQDVFKSIKYGWPDKAMQSWKDQYSPLQIQQLASYIKSVRGSNPAGAKEKQGELYKEDGGAPATDSPAVSVTKDTTAAK